MIISQRGGKNSACTAKWRYLLISCCLIAAMLPQPSEAGLFGKTLAGKIERVLRSPELAGTNTGIKVVALATGKTVYEENSAKLFIPASNVKLLTAYAALKLLTPQYTFTTEFAADASPDAGTVTALYVKGRGDPSLSYADIALQAQAVSARVRRVAGDLVIDNSYFDALQFGRGWMWDEGPVAWNAPLSPFGINGNCVDLYISPGAVSGSPVRVRTVPDTAYAVAVASAATLDTDSVAIVREETAAGDRFIVTGSLKSGSPERKWRCAVSRPGLFAGTLFREQLARNGVSVEGRVREGAAPPDAVVVLRYASRPLGDIVRYFLKDSDNFTGECLLKTMGAEAGKLPGDAVNGISRVREALRLAGVGEKGFTLADGSGMSMYNLVSPDTMTRVLQCAYRDFSIAPEFLNALAIAGVDGTLKDRLRETPAARNFRAKTGTLTGVSAISGYLQTRRGNLLAVSLLMNGYTGSAAPLKAAQDEILRILWESL